MAIQDEDGSRLGSFSSEIAAGDSVGFVGEVAASEIRSRAPSGPARTVDTVLGLVGLWGDAGLFAGEGAPGINIFVEPLRANVTVGRMISVTECSLSSFSGSETWERLRPG